MLISLNGKIVTKENANISLVNNAFLYGFGVLETMRTYYGQIFRLDDHIERLFESAKGLKLSTKWNDEKITYEMLRALQQFNFENINRIEARNPRDISWVNQPAKKLCTENKSDSRFCGIDSGIEVRIRIILTETDLIIMMQNLEEKPKEYYEKGVKLVSFSGKRTLPKIKKIADAFCYSSKQYALKKDAYESVFIDDSDFVRECTYSNIFWVKDEQVFTVEEDVLFGITRDQVIEIVNSFKSGDIELVKTKGSSQETLNQQKATPSVIPATCPPKLQRRRKAGIYENQVADKNSKFLFQNIKYKDLLKADEIFITQTTSGILPVVEIDEIKIGEGKPGKMTKNLIKKLNKLVWKN